MIESCRSYTWIRINRSCIPKTLVAIHRNVSAYTSAHVLRQTTLTACLLELPSPLRSADAADRPAISAAVVQQPAPGPRRRQTGLTGPRAEELPLPAAIRRRKIDG